MAHMPAQRNNTMMRFLFTLRTWATLAGLWAAAVAYRCWSGWPHLPLDVSAGDQGTIDAFNHAVMTHVGLHAGLAIVPSLVVLLIGRMVCGAGR